MATEAILILAGLSLIISVVSTYALRIDISAVVLLFNIGCISIASLFAFISPSEASNQLVNEFIVPIVAAAFGDAIGVAGLAAAKH